MEPVEQQEFMMVEDVYEAARITARAIAASHEPKKAKAWAKVVGHMLWPSKDPDDAGKYFANCLDNGRQEKLDPEQLLWLAREGKRVSCHVLMTFMCDAAEYAKPVPVEPEDEVADLMQQSQGLLNKFDQVTKRMERLMGVAGPFSLSQRPRVASK